MNEERKHIEAWPLAWPPGWRRTSSHLRSRANFHEKEAQRYEHGDGTASVYRVAPIEPTRT